MTPDALRTGYAPVAAAYHEQLGGELEGKPLDRALLAAFVEQVRGPIVDVGCGPGHVAAHLARLGATVEGIDLSPEMIDQARAAHPGIAFRTGDLFALPCPDGAYAGIVAFYAIVHTRELAAAFAELARVMAPGGRLLLAFHAGSQTVHVDELFGQRTSLDFHFHEPETVIAALAGARLSVEAQLVRAPYPAEHASQRCYLLAART